MKRPVATALNSRIAPRSKAQSLKKSTVISCCEVDIFLFIAYSNDELIAEADADMMSFLHPSSKSAREFNGAFETWSLEAT